MSVVRRPVGLAEGEQLAGANDQPLETVGVELVAGGREQVAVGRCLDGTGPEHLAEPDDAPLQDLARRRGRVLTPEHVDQLLGADGVTGSHRQGREDHSIPRTQVRCTRHEKGAEDCDVHLARVDLSGAAVNAADTWSIPVR